MKLTHHSDRHWQRVMKALALAVAGVALLVPGGGPAQAASPTLEAIQGLPQAWDKTLPANDPGGPCPASSSRFTCVMGGAAVRDNETGLVWERSPSTATFAWEFAQVHCNQLNVGNRKGWRLPTIQELASLVDPTVPFPGPTFSGPTLPAGHPFSNVQSSHYWSATTSASNAGFAWGVFFDDGGVGGGGKSFSAFVWCVRGGQGVDPQ
jgi:hypothetical protein